MDRIYRYINGVIGFAELMQDGVNAQNEYNWTPLTMLIHAGKSESLLPFIKRLILMGANLNARSVDGCTLLMYSVLWNHPEVVSILVLAGINPEVENEKDNFRKAIDYALDSNKTNIENKIAEALYTRKKLLQQIASEVSSTPLLHDLALIVADYSCCYFEQNPVNQKPVKKPTIGFLKRLFGKT